MDTRCQSLQYRNMSKTRSVPTYALYGESESWGEWVHWETIQARSRLHAYRIAPHRHGHLFQILSVSGGRGRVTLDGSSFGIGAGSLVVVPALTVHSYEFDSDINGVVVTLMERDITALGFATPAAGVLAQEGRIGAALDGLIGEADQPGTRHSLVVKSYLTLLLIALERAEKTGKSASRTDDRSRAHARKFRELVDEKFRMTRRISDYANLLGITSTHLNRVCRQVLNASALEVIEGRILLEARRQLMFSDLSIKEIGAGLGYDDPGYFTRVITRALGETPTGIRRRQPR
jgi:AraC family transcriptional activator of pobA